ncbi:hypothetical protein D3C83_128850 [compost metagenome]
MFWETALKICASLPRSAAPPLPPVRKIEGEPLIVCVPTLLAMRAVLSVPAPPVRVSPLALIVWLPAVL